MEIYSEQQQADTDTNTAHTDTDTAHTDRDTATATDGDTYC